MRLWKAFAAGALALVAAGCLVTTETRHTFYLDPQGGVTWGVLELELRSDEDDADARRREEAEYLASFAAGEHPIAEALRGLGAQPVTAQLVRARRPYTTYTEGRFPSVAALAETVLAKLSIPGSAWFERDGEAVRLVVEMWPEEADEAAADAALEELSALLDAVERHRIVLTGGHFTAAQGFRLEDKGRVAVGEKITEESLAADGGRVVLSLTWRAD